MPDYDIAKMRKAIKDFAFWSKPSSANDSTVCTVGDINKVITNMAKMMNKVIDELERNTDQ
jgi:hypothetical protein